LWCPFYHRSFEPGHFQFITTSTYRCIAIFANPAYARLFAQALEAARHKFGFLLVGWVLMPEHFHLLFQPVDAGLTSAIVKDIEQRSAAALLQRLSARSWLFSKILWF
jgi:putative transposase